MHYTALSCISIQQRPSIMNSKFGIYLYLSQITCDMCLFVGKSVKVPSIFAYAYLFFSALFTSRLFPIWLTVVNRQHQTYACRFFSPNMFVIKNRQPPLHHHFGIRFSDDFAAPWVSRKLNIFILYALLSFFPSNLGKCNGLWKCRWDCVWWEKKNEQKFGWKDPYDRQIWALYINNS